MNHPPLMVGLGRRFAPDERDKAHLMALYVPHRTFRLWRYWNAEGWWGDQGSHPHCVAYAWTHLLEDGPVTHGGTPPLIDPVQYYYEFQRNDEWPGENYDGTSVRAGAKVLQRRGLIGEYVWCWDLLTCIQAVLTKTPVVIGSNWYRDMFYPDSRGFIKVGGAVEGGHAYVINGVNKIRRIVRIKNSWGRWWGKRGHAYLHFNDLARLIAEDGEVCAATEIKL